MAWPLYPYRGSGSEYDRLRAEVRGGQHFTRHHPTADEVEKVTRLYSEDDAGSPPWPRIQSDLVKAGHTALDWPNMTAPALIAMLPTKGRKKRGRGRRVSYDRKKDEKLASDWQSAKASGSTKAEFCKSRGIKQSDLNRLLTRVRKRRAH